MEQLRPVFSVHELNEYVDLMIGHDPNLSRLTVEGELSGCKRHPNGHLYFTLKDETASVACVMWRQYTQSLRFLPRDGMQVRLVGSASFYTRDGRFQLYATALQRQGEGDLFAAFCRYRDALKEKGWFDEDSKKPIPKLPVCVGVVTSAAGAALQDIRNVIGRRFPSMPIQLYPASVQGMGAAEEIAKAIDRANAENIADVLIVGRGGGSMEDLWAFNEPPVAEAVHRSMIPIISAVGHETDFSICDFVADMRAPTPSAAAELAVPEYAELTRKVFDLGKRLQQSLHASLQMKRDRLSVLWSDGIAVRTENRLSQARQHIEDLQQNAVRLVGTAAELKRTVLLHQREQLQAYSPQKTLERGYALIYRDGNELIQTAKDVATGDSVRIRFADGAAEAKILGKDCV